MNKIMVPWLSFFFFKFKGINIQQKESYLHILYYLANGDNCHIICKLIGKNNGYLIHPATGYELCCSYNMISVISNACRWLDWDFQLFLRDKTELSSSHSIQLWVGNAETHPADQSYGQDIPCKHLPLLAWLKAGVVISLSNMSLRMSVTHALKVLDWAK